MTSSSGLSIFPQGQVNPAGTGRGRRTAEGAAFARRGWGMGGQAARRKVTSGSKLERTRRNPPPLNSTGRRKEP